MSVGATPSSPNQITALQSALDVCKQVQTLITVVLTLTIAFLKDVTSRVHRSDLIWLRLSWFVLLLALLLGVLAMGAVTSEFVAASPDVNNGTVRWTAIAQQVAFFVGLALLTVFGVLTAYAQHR